MKIRTEYVCPPIPSRSSDWSAVDDDTYEGGAPIGRGATEVEAVCDLIDQLIDQLESRYEAQLARLQKRIETLSGMEQSS